MDNETKIDKSPPPTAKESSPPRSAQKAGNAQRCLKAMCILAGITIAISLAANIFFNLSLQNKIVIAHERGAEEGKASGAALGLQHGEIIGYQTGGTTGFQEGSERGEEEGRIKGYKAGKQEGYNFGYETGFKEGTGTDYLVRNPTYLEAKELIDKFTSAWEIDNEAESKGIRAACVALMINDAGTRKFYEVVAFETIDRGLIFFDSTTSKEINPEVGQLYNNHLISEIKIVW